MSIATKPGVLGKGERIAPDYEVVALVHRSRDLDVYEVHSDSRDCSCVAKLPRPDHSRDARTRAGLLQEGRLLLSFTHPHLVRAYELIEEPDPILILEALGGRTLQYVLAHALERVPVEDVALLGTHVCSALHYMHGRGVVHLDVKPSNIVIDAGKVKLLDLSSAREPGRVGPGAGSRAYMAPEQASGGEVGPPADVWGVGALLYEAATGRRAFTARADGYEQLERRAAPVARLRPRLPRALAGAIDAALDPDPAARPGVAALAEVAEAAALALRNP